MVQSNLFVINSAIAIGLTVLEVKEKIGPGLVLETVISGSLAKALQMFY